jgi:hypothetical protein
MVTLRNFFKIPSLYCYTVTDTLLVHVPYVHICIIFNLKKCSVLGIYTKYRQAILQASGTVVPLLLISFVSTRIFDTVHCEMVCTADQVCQ